LRRERLSSPGRAGSVNGSSSPLSRLSSRARGPLPFGILSKGSPLHRIIKGNPQEHPSNS
jgi:hypothetical protein